MVGGSLQARLDLDPRDVAYLQAMGHFVQAPPKPLTWRQRLRAVMQATEALVYLHTPHERKPRTLHRDFKPANILLDHDLHAYLGDTGFAKAARQSGEFSGRAGATTGRIMCSPGYADVDVLNGEYSVLTDGFAVGVTLLIEPEPGLLIETFGQYLEFAERVNHPALGLNFDIGHAYCVGEDPAEWVPRMKAHTRHYHFEDIAATRVHHHLVPGEGAIDFGGVFQAIATHTPELWVTVELYPYRDRPDDAARAARAHLLACAKSVGVELA
jgi:hypothetical protein